MATAKIFKITGKMILKGWISKGVLIKEKEGKTQIKQFYCWLLDNLCNSIILILLKLSWHIRAKFIAMCEMNDLKITYCIHPCRVCGGDFCGYFWNGAKIVSLVDSWKALNKIWDFSHTQAVWDLQARRSSEATLTKNLDQ